MSSLSSVSSTGLTERGGVIGRIGPRSPQSSAAGEGVSARAASDRVDQVEVSAAALAASQTSGAGVSEKVARIKAQIDSGTYDLDEKVAVVADRLSRTLRGLG